ncbi:NADPH-dependent FMN reductase [Aestuariirhabdus litorea]|uniref:NADPH-dependent oxidoreductase n=1 Tax=Aestuariirhabdus litorea TaxID=2528527 RepID=A0A3P3VQP9_9GAMM|nr:NAD(P)H-dependent oxidoreductase [Aestuariirhabdus litorea]RRJ84288.1 NADPH-dependent oxidoreductase [Aestuariirhabdus litorea]RWW97511.1 NADPH-dependent oxidoreductase [Endozoicomonadaceae bacterium GTF-13]
MVRILAFAGSARRHSWNKKLVAIAGEAASAAGAEVTRVDLADYPMPIYCEDLEAEQGLPDSVRRFKQLLVDHDGFLIASPEHNSAYSALLKNAIDWCSRREQQDEPSLLAFNGKVAALMSTSPGALGGLRGLVSLRMLLGNIGVLVLPQQQAVGNAVQAFGEEGQLLDPGQQSRIEGLGVALVETVRRLNGG